MSELIQEILVRSTRPRGPNKPSELDTDYFAKLIILECIAVCETMALIGPYKEVQDSTLKDAVTNIKEHFGID